MIAVIQSTRVIAVGRDDKHAFAAALTMPPHLFDPHEPCLFVPAKVVDPELESPKDQRGQR